MVVIKYKKIDEGMFFSQINMIRIFKRLLSICDISLIDREDKKGKLLFSSPTRVGVESQCEYVVIQTDETAKNISFKFENALPKWLEIVSVVDIQKNLNIASLNSFARYEITFDEYKSCKSKILDFLNKNEILVSYKLHGNMKTINVKPGLRSFKLDEFCLYVVAKVEENSVRIDEFVRAMLKFLGKSGNDFNIVKTNLYTTDKIGGLVDIDDVIKICNLINKEKK